MKIFYNILRYKIYNYNYNIINYNIIKLNLYNKLIFIYVNMLNRIIELRNYKYLNLIKNCYFILF